MDDRLKPHEEVEMRLFRQVFNFDPRLGSRCLVNNKCSFRYIASGGSDSGIRRHELLVRSELLVRPQLLVRS